MFLLLLHYLVTVSDLVLSCRVFEFYVLTTILCCECCEFRCSARYKRRIYDALVDHLGVHLAVGTHKIIGLHVLTEIYKYLYGEEFCRRAGEK